MNKGGNSLGMVVLWKNIFKLTNYMIANFMLFLLMTGGLLIIPVSSSYADSFSDVQEHWAEKTINTWVEKGLVGGYPDGTFVPDNNITRAEFMVLTNRAMGISNDKETIVDFSDVTPDDWYFNDLVVAKNTGYISGYNDGTFQPNEKITRQEAASFLARLLNLKPETGGLTEFTDSGLISEWSRGNIGALVKNGLMNGFPDHSFCPLSGITRAETLVLLDRALDKMKTHASSAIEGTVTSGGENVNDAKIRAFNAGGFNVIKEMNVDAKGYFKMELEPGEYDITATSVQEVAYMSKVIVSIHSVSTVNPILEKASMINGIMRDKYGKVVGNCTICFTTNPTFVTTTDDNGSYVVLVLPQRTYTVRALNPSTKSKDPYIVKDKLEVGTADQQKEENFNVPFSIVTVVTSGSSGGGGGGGSSTSNIAPVVIRSLDPVTRTAGSAKIIIDASVLFKDADNDVLTYGVTSSNGYANVEIYDKYITVIPVQSGIAVITVTASDGKGGMAYNKFNITVMPANFEVLSIK